MNNINIFNKNPAGVSIKCDIYATFQFKNVKKSSNWKNLTFS